MLYKVDIVINKVPALIELSIKWEKDTNCDKMQEGK